MKIEYWLQNFKNSLLLSNINFLGSVKNVSLSPYKQILIANNKVIVNIRYICIYFTNYHLFI